MAKRYYWLKLKADWFSDKRIKKLRSMERGTEYGLEQVYNVVDSRCQSKKPLIVTTNLTLEHLQNPEDTAHARIYDRLLEMCVPVRLKGENFRRVTAQQKMERIKKLMEGGESQ